MISYFLLLSSIVLFVWGLVNIIKGWCGAPAEDAVPLSDLEAVEDLRVGPSSPLAQEPLEDYKKKIASLEEEIGRLGQKADQQARADQERIAQIEKERARSREDGEKKLEALEEKIAGLQSQKEQLLLSKEVVDEFKSKNEYLAKRDCEHLSRIEQLEHELLAAQKEINERQDKWHQSVSGLKEEKEGLFAKLCESEEKLRKAKVSLDLIEKTNNQRLNEANRAIDLLKTQRRESDLAQAQTLERKLAEVAAAAEVLTREKESLLQEKASLEQNFQKVKEFNAHLLEKTKFLQYELTKQRAQALGLERICEDFKVQIEEKYKSSIAKA